MGLSWGSECWGALRTPQPEGRREQLIDLFSNWLENCAFNPLVKTIAGHCGVMEKTGGKGGVDRRRERRNVSRKLDA